MVICRVSLDSVAAMSFPEHLCPYWSEVLPEVHNTHQLQKPVPKQHCVLTTCLVHVTNVTIYWVKESPSTEADFILPLKLTPLPLLADTLLQVCV